MVSLDEREDKNGVQIEEHTIYKHIIQIVIFQLKVEQIQYCIHDGKVTD